MAELIFHHYALSLTAVTRVTVLLSSLHCGSRPFGGYAFVLLPPRHIELLGDSAKPRDSLAHPVPSCFDREIVCDPCPCPRPTPLI